MVENFHDVVAKITNIFFIHSFIHFRLRCVFSAARAPLRCRLRGLLSVAGCGAPLCLRGLLSVAGCGGSSPLRAVGLPSVCRGLLSVAGCGGSSPLRAAGLPSGAGCGPQRLPVGWRAGFSSCSAWVRPGGSRPRSTGSAAAAHRFSRSAARAVSPGQGLSLGPCTRRIPIRGPPGTSLIVFLKYQVSAPGLKSWRHLLDVLSSDPWPPLLFQQHAHSEGNQKP